MFLVDNAVIMAAGMSSRFAPLSFEKPKALIEVKGEVLIERQIRQLREAGIKEIIVVTGYKAEMLEYLREEFGVKIIRNPEYVVRNNNASVFVAKEYLKNTYICSADNYFVNNPFEESVSGSYYAALYANGTTKEWCMHCDESGRIRNVKVGGKDAWYMLGHAFWDERFSAKFRTFLEAEYDRPETVGMFWEEIYINHIDELELNIRKYSEHMILEFDTLDELRRFDESYIYNSRSKILKEAALQLNCSEKDIEAIYPIKDMNNEVCGFRFRSMDQEYQYGYAEGIVRKVKNL